MRTLSKEDLVEILTLLSIGWVPNRIYEYRKANEFRGQRPWTRTSIYRACDRLEESHGDIKRKKGSGRRKTVTTAENVERVQSLLKSPERAPGTHLSQRKASFATGIPRTSLRRIAKELGLKSLRKLRVHRLPRRIRETETVEQQRVRLCRELLQIPRLADCIVQSDEKKFSLEAPFISQNERVYTEGRKVDIAPERLLRPVSHLSFEKKLMISAGFSMRGKVFLHIFEENENVNEDNYQQLLLEVALPACARLYPELDFIFQQDGASPHTSRKTQELLRGLQDQFGSNFIPANKWPPYSPDANVCDYRAWADAMQFVYANGPLPTVQVLRERITEWWHQLPDERVRSWMQELVPRLQKIIDLRGRQCQQYFNKI